MHRLCGIISQYTAFVTNFLLVFCHIVSTAQSQTKHHFLAETSFLNNRGLYMPQPLFEDGFGFVFAAIIIVSVGAFFLQAWAKKRQEQTGQQFPVFSTFLAAFIFIPLVIFFIVGSPLSWELPIHKGFNIVKGTGMWLPPEFVALLLALSIYTASFIAEVVRAVSYRCLTAKPRRPRRWV